MGIASDTEWYGLDYSLAIFIIIPIKGALKS